MSTSLQAVKISDHVYWVGARDWGLRDFHGYSTARGTTYNSYLILADKITLVDTVKAPFKRELLSRIASVIDPERIDYIIVQHAEMDHSGCLPEMVKETSPKGVFASAMGAKTLNAHFGDEGWATAVTNGESLSLGNMNLTMVETRMLHWPDSMVTYLDADRILFSQDAFGLHLATSGLFVDENDWDIIRFEAAKYYANILMPYSQLIPRALNAVGQAGWDIRMIASDHGPIWRNDVSTILELYDQWALQAPTKKAVIVFDTMWGSTERMARSIADGVATAGAVPCVMPLSGSTRSDVATEILEAGALIVGSPTINNNLFPSMADVLTYLRGLKPKNLMGATFSSYGWSGEAQKQLEAYLDDIMIDRVEDSIRIHYVPTTEDLVECREMGIRIGTRLVEQTKGNL